tara:strand:- start:4405 stop:4659 length:255 start_codon:yes stop_codon:yes gene_type:complete
MNPFIGKNQSWLETELAHCQDELSSGKVRIEVDSDGVAVKHQSMGSIEYRIELILRRLHTIDPVTYPASDTLRINRTSARFRYY